MRKSQPEKSYRKKQIRFSMLEDTLLELAQRLNHKESKLQVLEVLEELKKERVV